MTRRLALIGGLAFAGGMLIACRATPPTMSWSDLERRQAMTHSPVAPLAPDPTNAHVNDPAAARLGQFLFFDPRLSVDGSTSCATCHDPAQGFADGRQLAEGVGTGTRHSPTVWNAAYQRWFFWDGRADSLWAQAVQPIERSVEMGSTRLHLLHLLASDASLRDAYEAIFGPLPPVDDGDRFPLAARPHADAPDHPEDVAWRSMDAADRDAATGVLVNVGKALAAYESRLLSVSSPFDRFVEGIREDDPEKIAALSPAAQRGLRVFMGRGECRTCHIGPLFTDGEFHNIGVPPLGGGLPRDAGRYEGGAKVRESEFGAGGEFSDDPSSPAAKRVARLSVGPEMWGAFRTPSLRNVALTAPYMHQGQFATLRDVLRYYSTLDGAVNLHAHAESILTPRRFTEEEIDDLIAFLESLTDESIDASLLRAPDGPGTPRAEQEANIRSAAGRDIGRVSIVIR